MQFIASNTGGQGKPYLLKNPSWAMPPKLRAELTDARLGRTCYADSMTRHELVGESCKASSPSFGEGGMSCDDMWAISVAAEWHIESQGVWLCGQGHPPVDITVDTCPTAGCPVQKTHLAEIAARYWLSVASAQGEVVALSATSYDNASAATHFANVFSNSRCGSHYVGWNTNISSDSCTDCNYSSLGDTNDDDLPDGNLVIMEDSEAVSANDHPHDDEAEEGHDQAERVAGGKAIWRGNTFAKTKYISFHDLVEKALAKGMHHDLAGSEMRTWNIRDACWIFLLNKARSEGTEGEIAKLLPPFCSAVPEERLTARLQYCTEASKKYPPGATESKRHPGTLLIDPPNTHIKGVKRKGAGDGQCGAPPSKVPRFSMTPHDFVKCMGSYMTANLSNSSESKNPMQLAEKILTRYYAKGTGPKDPQTSCSKQAEAPEAVEHSQPDLEIIPEPETEKIPEPPSSMSADLTGGPSPNQSGSSSRQKGKQYNASSHKSILTKDSLPKSSYKDQKSNRGGKSSYEYSSRSFVCGTYISPGVYCDQLREPRHTSCMACEKRTGCKPYNTRNGGRGGPRGGPPRGGFRGGYRGGRGGRQGGRGFGRGRGVPA